MNQSREWLDPRPAPTRNVLAGRPGAGRPRNIVFFDNGKMSPPYLRWVPVAQPLLEFLKTLGNVTVESADLLLESGDSHNRRAADWRARKIDGVVLGLCDAGVTHPTVQLAAAAECAGIPTAVICTDSLTDFAAVSASFVMPGLPLIRLPVGRFSSGEDLVAAVIAARDDIGRALTAGADQLRAAFKARFPFVSGLAKDDSASTTSTSAPLLPFADYAASHHMTDGLPVVEPGPALVQAMLGASRRKPGDIVIQAMAPSGAPVTVEQVAICAVMAGCKPAHLTFVLAALEALSSPEYRLDLATITAHSSANLLLFSGPAAISGGIASGRGCLGPGNAVNAAIGRAVSLTFINAGRAIPGLSVLSAHGSPAQITCCFADAPDGAFPPLHTQLAGPDESIVWVQKCESPHNVVDHLSSTPESLLSTFAGVAATVGGNNSYLPSDLLVIMNPEHAELVVRAGWSRQDVQQFLWKKARNPRAALDGRGVKSEWPEAWSSWDEIPVVQSPDNIWVVVAGAASPQSLVAVPWGYTKAAWRKIDPPLA